MTIKVRASNYDQLCITVSVDDVLIRRCDVPFI